MAEEPETTDTGEQVSEPTAADVEGHDQQLERAVPEMELDDVAAIVPMSKAATSNTRSMTSTRPRPKR